MRRDFSQEQQIPQPGDPADDVKEGFIPQLGRINPRGTMGHCAIRNTPTKGAEIRYENGYLEDNMPFVAFMRSVAGRLLRVALGGAILWYGFAQLHGAEGTAVGMVGIVPTAAGFFNFCLFGPLFGLSLMGQPTAQALTLR